LKTERGKTIFRIPRFVEIGNARLDTLSKILQKNEIDDARSILLTSEFLYNEYTEALSHFNYEKVVFVESNKYSDIKKLANRIKQADIILGFGGGRIIDMVKMVATEKKIEYVALPSTLSHDGIYSPVARLNHNGSLVSFGADIPLGIVVDLDIVATAPVETLISGVGDLISNMSALKDWELAHKIRGETVNYLAYTVSRNSYNFLLKSPANLRTNSFLKELANGLIMSGLAMEIAKSSRPCSGSEHNISHVIDQFYPNKSIPHGCQVAFGTYITESLRGENTRNLKKMLKQYHLFSTPKELGFTKNEFYDVLQKSKTFRDRYTILNYVDNIELKKLVESFYDG